MKRRIIKAAIQISKKVGVMCMRVKVKVPVTGVGFAMPTWSVSGKYSAYISAYEWKGSYSATVAAEPAPVESESVTEPTEEKASGCGSFAAAPLAAVIPAAVVISKKKKNKKEKM